MEWPSTTDTGRGPSACAAGATPRKVRWLRTFNASPRTRTRWMNDLLGSTAIGTTPVLATTVRPVTAGMSLEKVAVTSIRVFSKRGMSLERPDLGDARGVDPL